MYVSDVRQLRTCMYVDIHIYPYRSVCMRLINFIHCDHSDQLIGVIDPLTMDLIECIFLKDIKKIILMIFIIS